MERLEFFIERLQDALGVVVDLEKYADQHEYKVRLIFQVTLKGKVWPEALHKRTVRAGIEAAVLYALDKKIREERNK